MLKLSLFLIPLYGLYLANKDSLNNLIKLHTFYNHVLDFISFDSNITFIISLFFLLCLYNLVNNRNYTFRYTFNILKNACEKKGFIVVYFNILHLVIQNVKNYIWFVKKNNVLFFKLILTCLIINFSFPIILEFNDIKVPSFKENPSLLCVFFSYKLILIKICTFFVIYMHYKNYDLKHSQSYFLLLLNSFTFFNLIIIYAYFFFSNIYLNPYILNFIVNISKISFMSVFYIVICIEDMTNLRFKPATAILASIEYKNRTSSFLSPFTNTGDRYVDLSIHKKINYLVSYKVSVSDDFKIISSVNNLKKESPMTYILTNYGYRYFINKVSYYNKFIIDSPISQNNMNSTSLCSSDTISSTTIIKLVGDLYFDTKKIVNYLNISSNELDNLLCEVKKFGLELNNDKSYFNYDKDVFKNKLKNKYYRLLAEMHVKSNYNKLQTDLHVFMQNNIEYDNIINTKFEQNLNDIEYNKFTDDVTNYELPTCPSIEFRTISFPDKKDIVVVNFSTTDIDNNNSLLFLKEFCLLGRTFLMNSYDEDYINDLEFKDISIDIMDDGYTHHRLLKIIQNKENLYKNSIPSLDEVAKIHIFSFTFIDDLIKDSSLVAKNHTSEYMVQQNNYNYLLDAHLLYEPGNVNNSNENSDDSLNPYISQLDFIDESFINVPLFNKLVLNYNRNDISINKEDINIEDILYDSELAKNNFISFIRSDLIGDNVNVDNSSLSLERLLNYIYKRISNRSIVTPYIDNPNLPIDSPHTICNHNRIMSNDTLDTPLNIRDVKLKINNIYGSSKYITYPSYAFENKHVKDEFYNNILEKLGPHRSHITTGLSTYTLQAALNRKVRELTRAGL